jgi:hypothetical protein
LQQCQLTLIRFFVWSPDAFHDCAENVAAVKRSQSNEKQVEAVDQFFPGQNEAEHYVA